MTYLNIMNNVLRRLREEEVNSVNDSTYSKMAGDFINDAKTIVEQAADWSALRTRESAFVTTADDNLYSLTGSGDDVKIMSVYDTTSAKELEYQTKEWFNNESYVNKSLLIASKGGLAVLCTTRLTVLTLTAILKSVCTLCQTTHIMLGL